MCCAKCLVQSQSMHTFPTDTQRSHTSFISATFGAQHNFDEELNMTVCDSIQNTGRVDLGCQTAS